MNHHSPLDDLGDLSLPVCDALLLISQLSHLLLHLLVAAAQCLIHGLQLNDDRKNLENITEEHLMVGERQKVD